MTAPKTHRSLQPSPAPVEAVRATSVPAVIGTAVIATGEETLSVLRSETALSRFPLHCLSKGKGVQIALTNQAAAVLWRVDPNSRYGQPGALAYKLDSLFINRRLEAAGRPVPKLIRLGSLREIAAELGSGNNTGTVKQALLQNATASITAKISYRTRGNANGEGALREGGERWLEAVFNRYSVVFTGERLPHGACADAVYLVLGDLYQEILDTAIFRPLDYEYMRSLPPIAQRFYEIVSYQMYAAVRHGNPRARLLYSEYCSLSTATRYPDFDHVKKQMYKVLRPHMSSGYIAKVEYQPHIGATGDTDWWMYYTPGAGARREYQAFTARAKTRALPAPRVPSSQKETGTTNNRREEEGRVGEGTTKEQETGELVEALVSAQLNRVDARRFAQERPDVCRRQLEFLPFVGEFKTSQGAYLRRAIENDFSPPPACRREAPSRPQSPSLAKPQRRADPGTTKSAARARQSHEERFKDDFAAFVGEWVQRLQKTHPEAFGAFGAWETKRRNFLLSGPWANRPLARHALESFDWPSLRADRVLDFYQGEGAPFGLQAPTFWEWDATWNPQRFGHEPA